MLFWPKKAEPGQVRSIREHGHARWPASGTQRVGSNPGMVAVRRGVTGLSPFSRAVAWVERVWTGIKGRCLSLPLLYLHQER